MKKIELNRGLFALVDDEDYDSLSKFNWYAWRPRNNNDKTYAVRHTNKNENVGHTIIHMHRIILNPDKKEQVDHIDCNGLNNQKYNLRKCSIHQNRFNMIHRTGCSSKYQGVYWFKPFPSWACQISYNKKMFQLGYHKDEILAAKIYDAAAIYLFGDFANLNFPESKQDLLNICNQEKLSQL